MTKAKGILLPFFIVLIIAVLPVFLFLLWVLYVIWVIYYPVAFPGITEFKWHNVLQKSWKTHTDNRLKLTYTLPSNWVVRSDESVSWFNQSDCQNGFSYLAESNSSIWPNGLIICKNPTEETLKKYEDKNKWRQITSQVQTKTTQYHVLEKTTYPSYAGYTGLTLISADKTLLLLEIVYYEEGTYTPKAKSNRSQVIFRITKSIQE